MHRPRVPGKTTVAVRLVHASDNKPVDGATIVEAKTDMGPAGMAEMSGKVTPVASDQPGRVSIFDRDRDGREVGAGAHREGAAARPPRSPAR